MKLQERRLEDLVSIGPAMMRDLKTLRIRSLDQLAQPKSTPDVSRSLPPEGDPRTSAAWMSLLPRWPRRRTRTCPSSNGSGGTGAGSGRRAGLSRSTSVFISQQRCFGRSAAKCL
jgi:hypothetical protein